jgi:hypothetical protein
MADLNPNPNSRRILTEMTQLRQRHPQITPITPIGYGQYHLAVTGGCAASKSGDQTKLRTQPLPRGGTYCIQSADEIFYNTARWTNQKNPTTAIVAEHAGT